MLKLYERCSIGHDAVMYIVPNVEAAAALAYEEAGAVIGKIDRLADTDAAKPEALLAHANASLARAIAADILQRREDR